MSAASSRATDLLFTPRRWVLYVLVAAALSLAGAIPLAALARLLFPEAPGPDLGGGSVSAGTLVVLIAIVSPVIETLLMSGPVLLLNRLGGRWVAVIGSAMLWGVLHSLLAPTWGVAIWWPFLIFSTAFLTWREKGYWVGIATAATIHLLNNVGPALLIARG